MAVLNFKSLEMDNRLFIDLLMLSLSLRFKCFQFYPLKNSPLFPGILFTLIYIERLILSLFFYQIFLKLSFESQRRLKEIFTETLVVKRFQP